MLRRPLRFLARGFHSARLLRNEADPLKAERYVEEVDVCIVGAGPSGLSAAIKLRQMAAEKNKDLRVFVVEKGSEVGELSLAL